MTQLYGFLKDNPGPGVIEKKWRIGWQLGCRFGQVTNSGFYWLPRSGLGAKGYCVIAGVNAGSPIREWVLL